MNIRKVANKIQLRRTEYVPVEHIETTDAQGQVIQVRKPGTGQSKAEMIASFDYDAFVDTGRAPLEVRELLTPEELASLASYWSVQMSAHRKNKLKTAGEQLLPCLGVVISDLHGAGVDQLFVDQVLNALDEFKAKAKDAGLKIKTAPVRAKEAEKRHKAGEETLF
jgi:hypothetical protein